MEKSRLMKHVKDDKKQYYRSVMFSTLHSECGIKEKALVLTHQDFQSDF